MPKIQAWAFLDPDYALTQARALDQLRLEGKPIGPLHGVPIAIKDIFDTADMPTEYGSVIYAGRMPSRDATAISLLRAAGAVIMGKTVTTEFAYFSPGKTRNPHNPEHTPGGSSSGSAAAIGANMAPLPSAARPTDRRFVPAAYCGVIGFKPTHGLISRHRVSPLSRTLDHVGLVRAHNRRYRTTRRAVGRLRRDDPDTRPRARIPFTALPGKSRRWRRCSLSSRHRCGSWPTMTPKKVSPRSSNSSVFRSKKSNFSVGV